MEASDALELVVVDNVADIVAEVEQCLCFASLDDRQAVEMVETSLNSFSYFKLNLIMYKKKNAQSVLLIG